MNYFFFPCSVGVRCQTKRRFALAAIDERGAKRLRTGKTKNKIIFLNLPIIRGISYFFAGFIALFATFWDSTKISEPIKGGVSEKVSEKLNVKKESVIISILMILSLGISLFLFGFVPSKLSFAMIGMSMNFMLRNFLIALTKVLLFFLILLVLRFIPAMQDLYKFNGAANQVKVRSGSSLKKDKFDHFYPLNILNVIVFTFILAIFVITCVGISIAWHWNLLINLAIFLICTGVSFEICYLCSLNKWTRLLSLFTDFFVSAKPNITHDEVARVAYSQISQISGEEEVSVKDKSVPLATVMTEVQTLLEKSGKFEKSDLEWIIATVLGKNRAEAKLVKSFDQKEYREIIKAANLRAQGRPLSSIFGFVEFYGLRFDVNKKVLAPRMETELLVETALKEIGNIKNIEVLDVGTGSGAIAVAIAKNSRAKVTALDVSKGALATAKSNAEKNGVKIEFIESDLFKQLKKNRKFDIIISNPPYIRTLDIEGLECEVKNYDPKIALDGGEDGLEFYRKIAAEAPQHLRKGGKIFLEIGQGQFPQVKKILSDGGFSELSSKKDYSKIIRVVWAKYDKRK